MAKPAVRLQVVVAVMFAGLLGLLARAAQVQLFQGGRWAAEAEGEHTQRVALVARRGALLDRNGTPLALTQETYHVGVAANELRDGDRDPVVIARQLHLSAVVLREALTKRYAYFAGPFSSVDVEPLRAMRGVHLETMANRFYPRPDLARAVIGRVGEDGRGASGLELVLDSVLAGVPGAEVVLKDRAGREYVSPARLIANPVAGSDVVLTLDAELQDIAERALQDAVARTRADGGDVVMVDPASGDVLAVASVRRDGSAHAGPFTDTFEPGSIAKIFAAAALLTHGMVGPDERVSGERGRWHLPERTIVDEEPLPSLTLADAIRVSSNIAMVKFAARLSPNVQYTTLRDFGFGTPTGVEFPGEATGRLRLPIEWSRLSPASLAMGYELAVTPIQVAAAYGALANDGVLLTPTLVRRIEDASGAVRYVHHPEPVRRVVTAEVAAALRGLLEGVVERGTGAEAALAHFQLAAKTGTARRVVAGRYAPGAYTASFAALFPADHPQIVLVVKLDDPKGANYFAAETAAPLTRAMLEQALATRDVALDRARLAPEPAVALPASVAPSADVAPEIVPWPYHPDSTDQAGTRPVPAVAGADLRTAVRALHDQGFRVTLSGFGRAERTEPAAGDSAAVGSVVRLFAAPRP